MNRKERRALKLPNKPLSYHAARYTTKEECWQFANKVTPLLKAHNCSQDDFAFGVAPYGDDYYALAMGYPTSETVAYVESLFEEPPAKLPPEVIELAWNEALRAREKAQEKEDIRDTWTRHATRKKLRLKRRRKRQ